jgi:putative NADH-flavin reductase
MKSTPTKEENMKVLVIGSTGGSGRATVERLVEEGHEVTAFARRSDAFTDDRVRTFAGDATDATDVERAVEGHDAVVVTLGISENPFRVRLFGPARTPIDIRSVGTRHVIAAMQKHGVRRLVVQTTYGVGATRERLRLPERLFFSLLLRPQIADTEEQQRAVQNSDLDWVLAQPVHLTDAPEDEAPFASTEGATGKMSISRRSVARFLAAAVVRDDIVHREVALSAPA